jgi:beta-N-acetylhexosaminidase
VELITAEHYLMKFKLLSLILLFLTFSVFPQLTLKQKIAQMIMVGFSGTTVPDSLRYDIENRKLGGVVLFGPNISNPNQLLSLTTQLQLFGADQLLISVDQEGGRVARLNQHNGYKATNSAYKLGTILNLEDSTRQTARMMAEWLYQSGININLAPVADVNVNPNSPAIGKLERSFSKYPDIVSNHILWFIDEFKQKNIITTLKHFPGHGSAAEDSHLGFTDITSTWADSELVPFKSAINQNSSDMIMIGHLFNANIDAAYPASLSYKTITDLLRDSLHYKGVVISDELFMQAISANYTLEEAVELCIKAGTDILLFNKSIYDNESLTGHLVDVITSKVSQGIIPEILIDSSFNRIQRLKQRFITNTEITEAEIPNGYILYQNYPNPFNPSTKISWQSPVSSWQTLKVFDVLGNEVATLVNEEKEAGCHSIDFNASSANGGLPSGIYFYRIITKDFVSSKKMMLIK